MEVHYVIDFLTNVSILYTPLNKLYKKKQCFFNQTKKKDYIYFIYIFYSNLKFKQHILFLHLSVFVFCHPKYSLK